MRIFLPSSSDFYVFRVVALMMCPINDMFLSGSLDRTIRLWDLRSPNCQGLMHLNGRPVASFDPEGLIFAAGIDSRQLKLYDLRTFDKVLQYTSVCVDTELSLWGSLSPSPPLPTIPPSISLLPSSPPSLPPLRRGHLQHFAYVKNTQTVSGQG